MKTGSTSRMAKKCRECPERDACDNKRMEACAYIIAPSRQKPFSSVNAISPSANQDVNMGKIDISVSHPTVAGVIRQIEKSAYRRACRGDD